MLSAVVAQSAIAVRMTRALFVGFDDQRAVTPESLPGRPADLLYRSRFRWATGYEHDPSPGVRRIRSVADDCFGDPVGHRHATPMRTDRLVGVGQRVGHRAVLEVEFGHHRVEAAFHGHKPCAGVMPDESDQSVIPSLPPQVQPAIQRVETGLLDGRCGGKVVRFDWPRRRRRWARR